MQGAFLGAKERTVVPTVAMRVSKRVNEEAQKLAPDKYDGMRKI